MLVYQRVPQLWQRHTQDVKAQNPPFAVQDADMAVTRCTISICALFMGVHEFAHQE